MRDFLTALGLMLAIEGTLYAVFAGRLKEMLMRLGDVPPATIRLLGVGALALGVVVVWLARG
jgi:uncharacterized protein YjeT (DUF2065 family)